MGFKERFAAVPHRFVDEVKDPSAVVVYVMCQRHADPLTGVFNLSVSQIANRCDLGAATVQRALGLLRDKGWAALEGPPGLQRWRVIPPRNDQVVPPTLSTGGARRPERMGDPQVDLPMGEVISRADGDPEDQIHRAPAAPSDRDAPTEERIQAGAYDKPEQRHGIANDVARIIRAAWIRDVVIGWVGAPEPETGAGSDVLTINTALKNGATPSGILLAFLAVPKHPWLAQTKDEGQPCYSLRALLTTRNGALYEELRGVSKRSVNESKELIEVRADREFDDEVNGILPAIQDSALVDDAQHVAHGFAYNVRGLAMMPSVPIPVPNGNADGEVSTRCSLLSTVQRALVAAGLAKAVLEKRYWRGVVDPVFKLRESILTERRREHTVALIERDSALRGRSKSAGVSA